MDIIDSVINWLGYIEDLINKIDMSIEAIKIYCIITLVILAVLLIINIGLVKNINRLNQEIQDLRSDLYDD